MFEFRVISNFPSGIRLLQEFQDLLDFQEQKVSLLRLERINSLANRGTYNHLQK